MKNLIKRESVFDRVHNNEYYKEPVKKIINDIKKSKKDKIILTGTRCSGKSTVLYSLEKIDASTANPSIMCNFEMASIFYGTVDNKFTKEIYTHLYELQMANNILNYIKTYYKVIYDKYFSITHKQILICFEELNNFVRNAYYKELSLSKLFSFRELTEIIINKFREESMLETLTLIIDRFDWINSSSELSQSILSNYFNLFDKTIITSDDKRNLENKRSTELLNKGFEILKINYGTKKGVLREILKLYINYYNSNLEYDDKPFKLSYLNDDVLLEVIKKTKGNILMVLDALEETHIIYNPLYENRTFDEIFISRVEEQIKSRKRLDKISKSKKLHL